MTFRTLRKKLVVWLGPSLAYWTITVLGWTMKFEEIRPEIPRSFQEEGIFGIGAFWHGRLLMMPMVYKRKKLSFLVSSHRDGQIIGRALERFGFHAILGSTSRKGFTAFKQMLRAIQDGSDIAITPDGPKGPRYRVQIGVVELAKLTGRPIVPLTFSASRRKLFKTWDQFLLPYPFSKGVFVWGEPVLVDPKGDRAHLEERRALLEKRLNELTEEADNYFNPGNSRCEAPRPQVGASRQGSFLYIAPLDPVLKDRPCGAHAGERIGWKGGAGYIG